MKKLLFLLVVVVFGTSCAPQFYCKRCPLQTIHTIETRDTTIIREVLKDTTVTVYLPADSIITIHKVICDSVGFAQMNEVVIKHKSLIARLRIENGELHHNVVQLLDSLQVTIHYKETEIENLHHHIEKLSEVKEVKEKYIPKWVKFLAWCGGVSLFLIIMLLMYNMQRGLFGLSKLLKFP